MPKSVTQETIVSLTTPDPPSAEQMSPTPKPEGDSAKEIAMRHSNGAETKNDSTATAATVGPHPRRQLPSQVSVRSELDEVDYDRLSQLSLHMVKDFRYYFQVPYLRLFIAYLVVFCNFLIYAEDPVAHSVAECSIPVIGNAFAFVATRYPPNAWSLLKVVLWLSALMTGIVLGKLIHVFVLSEFCCECSPRSNRRYETRHLT